jgi:hypothetical protein
MVLRWIRSIPKRAHSQSLGRVNDRAAKPNNGYARSENILVLLPRLAASQCQVKKQRQLFLSTPQMKKVAGNPTKRRKSLRASVLLYPSEALIVSKYVEAVFCNPPSETKETRSPVRRTFRSNAERL